MKRFVFGVVVGMLISAALVGARLAIALESGDIVVFALPAEGSQPAPETGPKKDKFIFTGGKISSTDGGTCKPGSTLPVQNAVLVDPDADLSGRITGVVVISQTERVHPGTKLDNLTPEGGCTIGGVAYLKYNGTVR